MNPKISWEVFSQRRRLTLRSLCESAQIKTYKELSAHLNNLWVEAPKEDSSEWSEIAAESLKAVKERGVEKIRKTGLKPDGSKLTPKDDPEKVWEEALSASYASDGSLKDGQQAPIPDEVDEQPVVKKRSTTRRKSTSTRKTSTTKKKT